MRQLGNPGARTRAFVAWVLRRGALIWAVALLLAIPAVWKTVSLYRHLRSEVEMLLPGDAPSVKALDVLRARHEGLTYLAVVVDAKAAANKAAADRLLADLAERVRRYPADLVREVKIGQKEERDFLERHAPLYVALEDLKEVRRRIEARRDWEVAHESGASLDDDEAPSMDFADIEKKYDKKLGLSDDKERGDDQARFVHTGDHTAALFVELAGFTTAAEQARDLLGRVKADVAALGGTDHYAPGMTLGYGSDVAVAVEEHDALEEDLSISSALVIVAVMAVLVGFYRQWSSLAVLMPPLLVAASYAFSLASLPPFNVKELNSNTAFMGSIVVGNGMNYAIMLFARYREERGRGLAIEDAMVAAVWGALTGTVAASAAAGTAYGSLIATDFRGFRQFGFIGAIGMVTAWAAAFVLMPPLIKWFDRGTAVSARASLGFDAVTHAVARLVKRAPVGIVVIALGLSAVSAWKVSEFRSEDIERDFGKLRRKDTWTEGEGFWGRKLERLLGRYLTPTVLLANDLASARAMEVRLRASVEHGELEPYVASVRTMDDVVPGDQEAKLAEARALREDMTPKMRSLVAEDRRALIDKLLGDETLGTITAKDLPRGLTTGLMERDGTFGRSLLLYPRPSNALWKADGILKFVGALRSVAGSDGVVAGSIPISADLLVSILHDAPIATAIAFFGVVLVVLLVVGVNRTAVLALVSLVLGVLWLAGAMRVIGIKVNFTNFIAFPITIGIGVEYSINVVSRFLQDGQRDITSAVRATGGAVALCSATTIIGYSSLLLAKNQALYLFGVLAVTGEVTCLVTALLVMPAVLVLLARRLPSPAEGNVQ